MVAEQGGFVEEARSIHYMPRHSETLVYANALIADTVETLWIVGGGINDCADSIGSRSVGGQKKP